MKVDDGTLSSLIAITEQVVDGPDPVMMIVAADGLKALAKVIRSQAKAQIVEDKRKSKDLIEACRRISKKGVVTL